MDKSLKASRKGAKRRPNFPAEFKHRLVKESLVPEASVALIARRNDINANLLFKWRRQHLMEIGHQAYVPNDAAATPDAEFTTLLPVSIVGETPKKSPVVADKSTTGEAICEVEFGRARLRFRGEVSSSTLQLLIRELSR